MHTHNKDRKNAAGARNGEIDAEVLRRQDLARCLPLWPAEISDLSLKGRRRIVHLLARLLRQERRSARAGYWTYDVALHANLARLWRAERQALEQCEAMANKKGPSARALEP